MADRLRIRGVRDRDSDPGVAGAQLLLVSTFVQVSPNLATNRKLPPL